MARGNATKLAAGMTFTDEPGIYVPASWVSAAVTENVCENLAAKWSRTPEEPAVV